MTPPLQTFYRENGDVIGPFTPFGGFVCFARNPKLTNRSRLFHRGVTRVTLTTL
jgi:hypothetical protein